MQKNVSAAPLPPRPSGPRGRAALEHWLTRVLMLLIAALLGWRLVLFIARVVATLPHPFQFDPTEGILLSEFVLLTQRVNIYAPFTPAAFVSAPYPPVYYALVAPLLRFTGVNFVAGRAVALLATLAVALFAALIVARQAPRWWAWLAAACWLGSLPVLVWATRLKPDVLAVAFSVAGLWLAAGAEHDKKGHAREWLGLNLTHHLLPALCFALAFYSKQSAWAAGMAVGVWLLRRDWRLGLRWGILQAALLVLPFVLLDLVTRHGFWIHMVDYHALPWSARRWLGIVGDMSGLHAVLLVLTGVYLVDGLRRWQLPALYIVWAAVATFSGGTFGGFHNHALEWLAALCLGAALGLHTLWQRQRLRPLALALLAAQIAAWWLTPGWLAYELGNLPNAATTRRLEGIQRLVRGVPGPVWGDNVGLIVTAGKPVVFNDPLIMAQAADLGWWDDQQFRSMLAAGGFDLILWRGDLATRPNDLTAAQWDALRQHYRIKYHDVLRVYEPGQ